MRRRGSKPGPHPDPAVELKLRRIRDLDDMRVSCHQMIRSAQAEIESARKALEEALRRHRAVDFALSERQLKNTEVAVQQRIRRAEETIREQRATLLSLSTKIEEAVESSGLTEFDLSYLRLSS